MITLTLSIDNINTVIQVYDRIQIERAATELGTYTTVSGLGPVTLVGGTSVYEVVDTNGSTTDWYISRYYSTITTNYSSWSDPVLGTTGNLFSNPLYPPEINYGTSELLVINKIRLFIGDPKRLMREHGEEFMSSVHSDGKTYEMSEKGYPVSINMAGSPFNTTSNPTIDGYRYLRFQEYIDIICTSCSGITNICGDVVTREINNTIDLWYYTFRNSDRQIMEAYDSCLIPARLTTDTVTSQAYMLQTAIDIIRKELIEDATEDGISIRDEGTSYDPTIGLKIKKELLDSLKNQLKELVTANIFGALSGVLID